LTTGRGERTKRAATAALAVLAVVPCLLLASPSKARAQTPYTAVGIGYPIRSLDARSMSLGGVTNGLLGGTFSLGNPADLTLHSSAAVAAAIAGEDITVKAIGGDQSTGRSWFPVIGAVVPIGDWAFRVGFGGVLDQDMAIILTDTLSTSIGRFEFEELRTRDGGVSQIDVSAARKLGPVSVGIGIQRLTGSLQQRLRRRFTVDIDSTGVLPDGVLERAETDYGGWSVKAGANAQFKGRFVVSGTFFFAADLKADQLVSLMERTLRLPNGFEGGLSALITSHLLLTAGGGWSGWSQTEPVTENFTTASASWLGGGLEYTILVGSIPIAFRAGGRTRKLPFVLPDFEQSKENAITAGLGARIGGRVRVDLGLEFGNRGDLEAAGTEESFTSLNLTVGIIQ
jgi:hypothetical protein